MERNAARKKGPKTEKCLPPLFFATIALCYCGRFYFPKMVSTISPMLQSLLKCDLAISPSRGGIYFFTYLNMGEYCDCFNQQNVEEVMS